MIFLYKKISDLELLICHFVFVFILIYPSKIMSQTNLIDLANQSMTMKSGDDEQHKPFNRILSYLYLNSFQSLSKANRKCSQLLNSYICETAFWTTRSIYHYQRIFHSIKFGLYKHQNTNFDIYVLYSIEFFHRWILKFFLYCGLNKNRQKLYDC